MKNEKQQNYRQNFVFDVKWEALNTFGDSRIWHVRMQLTSLNHIFVFEFFLKAYGKIGNGYCMKYEKHQICRQKFFFDVEWEDHNIFEVSRVWHVRIQATSRPKNNFSSIFQKFTFRSLERIMIQHQKKS